MGVSFQEPKYPVLQPCVARTQGRCAASLRVPPVRPAAPPLFAAASKIPSVAGASGEAAISVLQHSGRRPLAVPCCGHGLARWACVAGPAQASRPR